MQACCCSVQRERGSSDAGDVAAARGSVEQPGSACGRTRRTAAGSCVCAEQPRAGVCRRAAAVGTGSHARARRVTTRRGRARTRGARHCTNPRPPWCACLPPCMRATRPALARTACMHCAPLRLPPRNCAACLLTHIVHADMVPHRLCARMPPWRGGARAGCRACGSMHVQHACDSRPCMQAPARQPRWSSACWRRWLRGGGCCTVLRPMWPWTMQWSGWWPPRRPACVRALCGLATLPAFFRRCAMHAMPRALSLCLHRAGRTEAHPPLPLPLLLPLPHPRPHPLPHTPAPTAGCDHT
jgi:hypothetical protein